MNARTEFASRAMMISDIFNVKFQKTKFSGPVPRIAVVDAEEKESTGGGKMARESILLVPENKAGGAANIVCGFVDMGTNTGEIRTYQALVSRHRQRFGDIPIHLDRGEYDAFVSEVKTFLAAENIDVETVDAKPVEVSGSHPIARTSSGSGSIMPMVIGGLMALVVLALMGYFLL